MASVEPSKESANSRTQSSRKGKKAWRRNVNIEDIEAGLARSHEEKSITGGKQISELSSTDLFQTDTTGSEAIHNQYRKNHPHLKSDEILRQRSGLPAVTSRKRRSDNISDDQSQQYTKRQKTQRVSQKELQRLKAIAYGGDTVYKDVIEHMHTATHDPWVTADDTPHDASTSFLDKKRPLREPKTLKQAPTSLYQNGKRAPNVRKPDAGRSYNPAFSDWSSLLESEGRKEVEAEKKRQADAEADRLKKERIEAAAQEADAQEDDGQYSDLESDWDGIQSDVDEAQWSKKRPQRKTQAERNKINRRKEAEGLEKHQKSMKKLEQQTKHVQAIKKEVDAKEAARNQALAKVEWEGISEAESDGEEQPLQKRFGGQAIPKAPLELVLPDELQDSLRLLKPEGNLLQDRFRNMMVQGKVEARKPVSQSRKAKRKATEKWSYKDFKVPGVDVASAKG